MGLNRRPKPGLVAAALVAITAGAALPAVTADAQRGHRGDRGHYNDGCKEGTRGTVCIGRTTHEFWFKGSPTRGLLAAFRDCGYDAWIEDGCIYVSYHGHRPRFSIRAPGYSFGVSYRRGCVVISPRCLAPPPRRTIRYRVRDSWGGRDYCPPPRYREHRGPRWGWNVSWNWGHRPYHGWHQPRRCR